MNPCYSFAYLERERERESKTAIVPNSRSFSKQTADRWDQSGEQAPIVLRSENFSLSIVVYSSLIISMKGIDSRPIKWQEKTIDTSVK